MLEILGSVVSSILSGGATGLLGVVAQRYADYKNKQLDFEHAVALKEIDSKIMAQEYAAKESIVRIEAAGASDVADSKAFAESYSLEPPRYAVGNLTTGQNWVMVLLDALRGAVRPVLTIYLCILVTIVYALAREKLRAEDLNAAQALELLSYIINTILYVWTTVTLWWFGTRNKSQPRS